MKRTILALLIVIMITTPCFAQEIEPDGLFSIEGTLWRSIALPVFGEPILFYWGFWGGTVYQGASETGPFVPPSSPTTSCTLSSSYNDLPLFSIFSFKLSCPTGEFLSNVSYRGVLFSLPGIGYTAYWGRNTEQPEQKEFVLYMLLKIDDEWTPPENEPATK